MTLRGLLPWFVIAVVVLGIAALTVAFDESCSGSLEQCAVYGESTDFLGR